MILGEEITHRDLVPVFDGFLKDLDEVRIGILRHLADFLRVSPGFYPSLCYPVLWLKFDVWLRCENEQFEA